MRNTLSAIVSSTRRGRGRPALYVGLCGEQPLAPTMRVSLADIDLVLIGRGPLGIQRETRDGSRVLRLQLDDPRMSAQHVRMTRVGQTWAIKDLESKNGTWIHRERIAESQLEDDCAIIVGHTALVYRTRGGEDGDATGVPDAADQGLRTYSVDTAAQFANIAAAARSQVPIELTGESGTGKELAARAVHALSGRPGRFVAVNCGSLPDSLLEAELFGHRKGAYTGATDDRLGFVRAADGGTLFLDEIAELPSSSQAALLRVLQEGEVVPLGADRPVKVDLRIVTATLKNLDEEVEERRFREDLRARLLGVRVELSPLRARREDLGWLIATFLEKASPGRPLTFAADTVGALYSYDWPLNIRELERALTAAVALARGRLELEHLPAAIAAPPEPARTPSAELSAEDRDLRASLIASLERNEGNLSAVARELGKDRKQIQRWIKRFGLVRS